MLDPSFFPFNERKKRIEPCEQEEQASTYNMDVLPEVSKFAARIQLSKAASLSGIGVTARSWSAVKSVRKFTIKIIVHIA